MAILAGGYGKRLGDLTDHTQKCMVEVNGRPFLEHVLLLLKRQGAERVVLCTGHLGEQVEACIGDGTRFGLDVSYSRDGEQPIGTAAALYNALPLLGQRFFVLYGDSYLPCDLRSVQTAFMFRQVLGLMAVCHPPPGYLPNVWFQHGFIWMYEKRIKSDRMHHIDYGLGILDARALTLTEYPLEPDLSERYTLLADQGNLAGYLSLERFYTIGTPASLALTTEYLRTHAH